MAIAVGWKSRVGLVLSATWLCLVLLIADDDRRTSQVLGLGVMPLVVIWGVVWAVQGWRAQRPVVSQIQSAGLSEQRAKRKAEIHLIIAVIAVLTLGLLAAGWQFELAGNEAGSYGIAGWLGKWSVFGVVAYGFLRAIPKLPAGMPAVLASLIVVGGVNWEAYTAIREERQALWSLARATPLIAKFQSGVALSDKDVLDARVGVLEPLLLAQAAYGREVVAIAANYQEEVSTLAPEQMLALESLASSNARFQTRTRVKLALRAVAEYKSQMDLAAARGKLGVQAALKQMPEAYSRKTKDGFDEAVAQLGAYIDSHVKLENEAGQATTAILDLLDASPSSFVVDKGPPPGLLFRDEKVLAQYRRHFSVVLDVAKREQENEIPRGSTPKGVGRWRLK